MGLHQGGSLEQWFGEGTNLPEPLQEGELQPALRTGEKSSRKKVLQQHLLGDGCLDGKWLGVGCSWIFGPAAVGGESL